MGSVQYARFQPQPNDADRIADLEERLAEAEARSVEWMMRWGSAAQANRAMSDIAAEIVRDGEACCGSQAFRVVAAGEDKQHGAAIEALRRQFRKELAAEWARQGRGMVDATTVARWLSRRTNAPG